MGDCCSERRRRRRRRIEKLGKICANKRDEELLMPRVHLVETGVPRAFVMGLSTFTDFDMKEGRLRSTTDAIPMGTVSNEDETGLWTTMIPIPMGTIGNEDQQLMIRIIGGNEDDMKNSIPMKTNSRCSKLIMN
ncbi:hypothetical protein L1987_10781 [Smallanthus sonchifolius]|uniref:Uncharacterized protein n=1 Tax=Smallanthus sonchifolius TaxID=185202 RepID=A0ACB9JBR6_9ASTR|nr:hypothetical protein L1987_10781 [Smallanthus sonchifolius]